MSRDKVRLRALLRERDGDNCYVCGEPIDFTKEPGTLWGPSLEHVIPLAAGGPRNDPVNLRLSHAIPCNNTKGAVHVGIDYALQFGPRPYDPSQVPRHQRCAAQQFEAWSAARA